MANQKKKKPVYKPYLKGPAFNSGVIKLAMKLFSYQIIFVVLYLLMSMPLSSGSTVLRAVVALAVVLICGTFVFAEGQRVGVSEAAHGEISYNRREEGKEVDPKDLNQSFNPVKPVIVVAIAVLIPFLICLAYALVATQEEYTLQLLPSWASSASGFDDAAGLAYYNAGRAFGIQDLLRILTRTLIFPFVTIVPTTEYAARLTVDRLSPILVILPFLGYLPGYWTGRRLRANMHGDIDKNKRRVNRQRKLAERKREERRKSTELI